MNVGLFYPRLLASTVQSLVPPTLTVFGGTVFCQLLQLITTTAIQKISSYTENLNLYKPPSSVFSYFPGVFITIISSVWGGPSLFSPIIGTPSRLKIVTILTQLSVLKLFSLISTITQFIQQKGLLLVGSKHQHNLFLISYSFLAMNELWKKCAPKQQIIHPQISQNLILIAGGALTAAVSMTSIPSAMIIACVFSITNHFHRIKVDHQIEQNNFLDFSYNLLALWDKDPFELLGLHKETASRIVEDVRNKASEIQKFQFDQYADQLPNNAFVLFLMLQQHDPRITHNLSENKVEKIGVEVSKFFGKRAQNLICEVIQDETFCGLLLKNTGIWGTKNDLDRFLSDSLNVLNTGSSLTLDRLRILRFVFTAKSAYNNHPDLTTQALQLLNRNKNPIDCLRVFEKEYNNFLNKKLKQLRSKLIEMSNEQTFKPLFKHFTYGDKTLLNLLPFNIKELSSNTRLVLEKAASIIDDCLTDVGLFNDAMSFFPFNSRNQLVNFIYNFEEFDVKYKKLKMIKQLRQISSDQKNQEFFNSLEPLVNYFKLCNPELTRDFVIDNVVQSWIDANISKIQKSLSTPTVESLSAQKQQTEQHIRWFLLAYDHCKQDSQKTKKALTLILSTHSFKEDLGKKLKEALSTAKCSSE